MLIKSSMLEKIKKLIRHLYLMNPGDFKKLVKEYTPDDITSDEPHVTMRCDENDISIDEVKKKLIDTHASLLRIVRDRPDVYKLYYRLNQHRELKVVIDLLTHKKMNIRTVKILDDRYRIGSLRIRKFK